MKKYDSFLCFYDEFTLYQCLCEFATVREKIITDINFQKLFVKKMLNEDLETGGYTAFSSTSTIDNSGSVIPAAFIFADL
ncbi:MAG: hypothetical protein FWD91_05580, partial [Treponema sp.]|nr:hypothetical protein [Treponema sp.]